ncbi:hypothetical protein GTA08_BOTSDO06142 [Neofusicoccum parvum]|nr:hypothetical protein GTA08_BOTSDO06142 [Neofusicoccum parvum]
MPGGLHPPLELVLAWQTDAFPHGIRRGPTLAVVVAVMFFLTLFIVCGRLYARVIVQRNAGLDDLLIALAMIPTTGLAVSIGLADRIYGFDRHIWDTTAELGVKGREITFAISGFYIISTGLTKISILCFYRRMATNTIERWFLWTVWASIAFVVGYMITFILTLCLGCKPIDSFWMQVDPIWAETHEWHCFDEGANILAASIISVVQDFMACGLPLLLFRKLQIPRRQKIVLGGVFGVGLFLCVTGILRIIYIHALFYTTYDVPWAAGPVWTWTAVEAHMAIICASAPGLKLFFRKMLAATGYATGSRGTYRKGTRGRGKGGLAGNTSFACVGEQASLSRQREYELESWRGARVYREAQRRREGGAGVERMGSLRGTSEARVERGSWFGEEGRRGRDGVGGAEGAWDLEGGIKVARRVDVTVTDVRDEAEFSGLEDEGKEGSARSSSETKLVKGGGRMWS